MTSAIACLQENAAAVAFQCLYRYLRKATTGLGAALEQTVALHDASLEASQSASEHQRTLLLGQVLQRITCTLFNT